MSDSLQPQGLHSPWNSAGQNTGVFPFSSRKSLQPRDWTQVFHFACEFFTSGATIEAKNTGMGSLSLLQQIFPTQELNHSLLHCRRILYQLSYQGSPDLRKKAICNNCFALLDTWTSTISYKILVAPSTHQLLGYQGSSLQICRKLFSITYMVLFFGI